MNSSINAVANQYHVQYNPDMLRVTRELMYRAAYVMGGRLYIDVDGVETAIPMTRRFCRGFDKMYFQEPVPCYVMWYGDKALGFERLEDGKPDVLEETQVYKNLQHFKTFDIGECYFDGEFIYSLGDDFVIDETNNLTSNRFFKLARIPCILPINFFYTEYDGYSIYHSIMCNDVICPPIWSHINSIAIRGNGFENNNMLDKLNATHVVSLQGVLRICEMSSSLFGETSIECFDLPSYMVFHKTVNLPALSRDVKKSSPSGLQFTDAIAFLTGKFMKCNELEQVIAIRKCMKYIASFGMISRSALEHDEIFRSDKKPTVINLNDQLRRDYSITSN